MNVDALINSLERFGEFLPAVVRDLNETDARWKPEDGAWSVLEVVNHLCDEETDDFRDRLDRTLRDSAEPWPPIDPEARAIERRYNEKNLADSLGRFTGSRAESIDWLRRLERPDWSASHQHPKLGSIRAGDILVSWVAHDALHLRQIAKRMHQLATHHGGAFSAAYAGPWRA